MPTLSLLVTLRIRNKGEGRAGYAHPETGHTEDERGTRLATLTTGAGKVKGQVTHKTLGPSQEITDLLLFSAPNAVGGDYLVVELPGKGFGAAGSVKFWLPRESVGRR